MIGNGIGGLVTATLLRPMRWQTITPEAQGMAERLENVSRLESGEGLAGLTVELEEIWTM